MTSTTTKQIRSTDARAATLRAEIDRLFAQPGKRRLKQNEALDVVARMDGSRSHHVIARPAASNDAEVPRAAGTPADGARRTAFAAAVASEIHCVCATFDEGDDHCANEVAQHAMADIAIEMANDIGMDRIEIVMRDDEGRAEVIAWSGATADRSRTELTPGSRQRRAKSIRQTLRALTEDGQTTRPWTPGQTIASLSGAWVHSQGCAVRRSVIDETLAMPEAGSGEPSPQAAMRLLLLVEVAIPIDGEAKGPARLTVTRGSLTDPDGTALRWIRSGER